MSLTYSDARDRLIVALDASPERADALATLLRGRVGWVKVGMTLFYQCGPRVVSDLLGMGYEVFLDLKLHDIPHQVEGAARSVAGLGARMITVHASGGAEMIAAAVRGAAQGVESSGAKRPSVLAVTVLTSLDDDALSDIGFERAAPEQVKRLGALAFSAGADGVVCSPLEAGSMRALLGPDALIVTPGVRPVGSEKGDQSRVSTPADALRSGASHLVVGRPITEAPDPLVAAAHVLAEMEA